MNVKRLLIPLAFGLGTILAVGLIGFVGRAAPGDPVLNPPRNSHTAPLTTTVSITYDEPISETTVTSRTFAVHGMQSGLVTATHSVVNGNIIVVTPTQPFHQGELVYAIATTRTVNITGTGPLSPTQWQFNTGLVVTRCVAGFTDIGANLPAVDQSSVAWGDYDNDGDLDILLTGLTTGPGSPRIAKVYRNDGGGTFTDIAADLPGVARSSVAWGDYDNEGDLDILLTGLDASGARIAQVYRNVGGGTFITETNASLPPVDSSSVAWGDYDNDGNLDILLSGSRDGPLRTARVYRNDGVGAFSDIGAGLTLVSWGSVAWGDYGNDGNLDILLTGNDGAAPPSAIVYRNEGGGVFTDIGAGLTGVEDSSVAWGDYDNDGDLDLLLTGDNTGSGDPITIVYRNDGGGAFTDIGAGLPGVQDSSVAWGDYDNDGDLDILLTGMDASMNRIASVYRNVGAGSFITETNASLTGVDFGSIAWGDYDDDGDLDILLTGLSSGGRITKVYRNDDCADIIVNPMTLEATLASGQITTETLTIDNLGDADLVWSLAENPAADWLVEDPITGTIVQTGSDNVTITFTATGLSEGIYSTTLDITSNDPIEPLVSVPVTLTVAREPESDLAIAKIGAPDPVTTGKPLTYTLVITNTGPDDATGIIVTDTLPLSVTFVSASAGCAHNSGIVTCSAGNMAPDDVAMITILVTAPDITGTITNQVEVAGQEIDPDETDNFASVQNMVEVEEPDGYNIFLPLVIRND